MLYEAGAGATMMSHIKPLIFALDKGRRLVTPRLSLYRSSKCSREDIGCYVKPLSECSQNEIFDAAKVDTKGLISSSCRRCGGGIHKYAFCDSGEDAVPQKFRHRGWFWLISQLVLHMMRPGAELLKRLQTTKSEVSCCE
jgi:hypothetical protein